MKSYQIVETLAAETDSEMYLLVESTDLPAPGTMAIFDGRVHLVESVREAEGTLAVIKTKAPDDDETRLATSEFKNYWGRADTPACPPVEPTPRGIDGPPKIKVEALIAGFEAGMAVPTRVDKWWGHELHYRNDDMYCMKWLHFKEGGHTSMHFHVDKHETLLVVSGVLTVVTIYDKKTKTRRLGPGAALVVPPGFVHRLAAAEGPVDLIEASTVDEPDDSVRVKK